MFKVSGVCLVSHLLRQHKLIYELIELADRQTQVTKYQITILAYGP